jgi:hypothetical protein
VVLYCMCMCGEIPDEIDPVGYRDWFRGEWIGIKEAKLAKLKAKHKGHALTKNHTLRYV